MYDGTHSLTFSHLDGTLAKNTWTNWRLIPTSRPTMKPPAPQTKFVEIDGKNGSYDVSDYLVPDMTYADRSGSFEFIVDTEQITWLTAYNTLESYLNGKRLRLTLEDDPEWYYEGRFTLNEFKSEEKYSKIVINYRVAPFKISIYSDFVENIIWDTFNFERDYDWSAFWHIEINNSTFTAVIEGFGIKTGVSARLVASSSYPTQSVTATFGNVSKTLTTVGVTVSLGETSRTGTKTLTLSGTGVIDIGVKKISM